MILLLGILIIFLTAFIIDGWYGLLRAFLLMLFLFFIVICSGGVKEERKEDGQENEK